jgi:hypothetical protein
MQSRYTVWQSMYSLYRGRGEVQYVVLEHNVVAAVYEQQPSKRQWWCMVYQQQCISSSV